VTDLVNIDDGKGQGFRAEVTKNNKLATISVTETEQLEAIHDGDGYNLHTGQISLSASSGVMYVKNNEDKDLIIDAIVVGIGAGSFSDNVEITMIRNPTTGTLISGATNVDMNQNRNFGSSNTLVADVYKGASGNTITDGNDILLIAQNGQGRVFATVGLVLQKGNSVGVRINPMLSSGSANVYAALIIYLEE